MSEASFKQNRCERWQRVDEAAERWLSKCAAQLHAGHYEAAETYHAIWVAEARRIIEGDE